MRSGHDLPLYRIVCLLDVCECHADDALRELPIHQRQKIESNLLEVNAEMIRFLSITSLLFAMMLGGCATHHGAANIVSIPQGAEVINVDDDTVLGVTPVKIWWREINEEKRRINVRLHKEGFRDKVTSFFVTFRHGSKDAALGEPQYVRIVLDKEE